MHFFNSAIPDPRSPALLASSSRRREWTAKQPPQPTLVSGVRLDKAQRGILGDVKPVSDGVFEMREFFRPGWRMYYAQHGTVLIVMLGGGDKSSQASDIAAAKKLAATLVFKEKT